MILAVVSGLSASILCNTKPMISLAGHGMGDDPTPPSTPWSIQLPITRSHLHIRLEGGTSRAYYGYFLGGLIGLFLMCNESKERESEQEKHNISDHELFRKSSTILENKVTF